MKKIINYFSFNSLKKEQKNIKLSMYIGMLIAFLGIGIILGVIFRLNLICIIIISLLLGFIVPLIIRKKHIALNNEKKFRDVDVYLHQMIYSFIRLPKIDRALKDTFEICDGNLKICIGRALDEISFGISDNVYRDAFNIIEDKYGCPRMRALHKFLISVESKGGDVKNSMRVLNNDFDAWVGNVYKFQNELRKIRIDTIVGLIISIVLALVTSFLCMGLNQFSQTQVDITKSLEYNIFTTFFLLGCILFFAWVIAGYKGDYLKNIRTDKQILSNYNLAYKTSYKKLYLKSIPIVAFCFLLSVISILLRHKLLAIYFLVAIIIVLIYPVRAKQKAKRIALNDLREGFTTWLRDLSLGLSKAPLIVALEQTYKDCPVILKDELEEFLNKIDLNPMDVTPYYEFLKKYECLDVSAAVRTLYSISDMDTAAADETINILVKRSNEISHKFDNEKYKDITSGLKFLEYLPTFLAAFKISVDMLLVITMYL